MVIQVFRHVSYKFDDIYLAVDVGILPYQQIYSHGPASCYGSLTMTLIIDKAITVITPLADTYADVLQLSPLQAQTPKSTPRYDV